MVKTNVWALISVSVTGRDGVNGNRSQPNYPSTVEHGKVEIGAEVLLRISREKNIEWLLTGES